MINDIYFWNQSVFLGNVISERSIRLLCLSRVCFIFKSHSIRFKNFICWNMGVCSAWPRLKLNTKIGVHTTHPQPTTTTTQTLNQQYLSCYWPDLDQTLNKESWELIQQIATGTTTFVQAIFVQVKFSHINNISAVTCTIWIKL